jgi:hypothetical protein
VRASGTVRNGAVKLPPALTIEPLCSGLVTSSFVAPIEPVIVPPLIAPTAKLPACASGGISVAARMRVRSVKPTFGPVVLHRSVTS